MSLAGVDMDRLTGIEACINSTVAIFYWSGGADLLGQGILEGGACPCHSTVALNLGNVGCPHHATEAIQLVSVYISLVSDIDGHKSCLLKLQTRLYAVIKYDQKCTEVLVGIDHSSCILSCKQGIVAIDSLPQTYRIV